MRQTILTIVILGCLLSASLAVKKSRKSQQSQNNENSEPYADIIARLLTAPTEVDRINMLQDSDFVFDFVNPPTDKTTIKGNAGRIVIGNRAAFPALTGNGITMALGFVGPCGMNTPHNHPRATEIFYSVNGTFETGFVDENGVREVHNKVHPGQATIFPIGSIQFQANLGCHPATFISVLSDEDPGVNSIAPNFYGIEHQTLSATLGGVSDQELNNTLAGIPKNVALGLDSCLQKCGNHSPK